MVQLSLLIVSAILIALSVFVFRAQSKNPINRWFAAFGISIAGWTLGIAALQHGAYLNIWGRFTFACASFIPPTFLAFAYVYPSTGVRLPRFAVRISISAGGLFAVLALGTELVVYDHSTGAAGPVRQSGLLYTAFALYFLLTWFTAAFLYVSKWRHSRGHTRAQLQYLGTAIFVSGAGAITSNLLLPLITGRSTYSWLGPYFGLVLITLVAHAIIRHHLMDLRLVIHQGLTYVIALFVSLLPVVALLVVIWPQLLTNFDTAQLVVVLAAIAVVSILIPLIRDVAERLLDTYVYRTHADYQHTVKQASHALTRVLELDSLLSFLGETVIDSTGSEGVAVYLLNDRGYQQLMLHTRHASGHFVAPEQLPPSVADALTESIAPIVTHGVAHSAGSTETRILHADLIRLDWEVILPVLSEDVAVGAIVIGPKLSGDSYYSQDLDLLTTLANQAGVAIKNAQLYEQVVLANEFIQNVVATIESGVVAINASGRITMFNRAAERLTGLSIERMSLQNVSALPSCLADALTETVKDGQLRAQPEIGLPQGTTLRPVICTTSPLRNPTGGILGAVTVFSDLTSLKELEIERQKAERLAYFGVLASGIAHEIKNPLVAIKTFAQLVPRRHKDEEFVEKFGRIVTREVGRMEHLVERLRTLSQLGDRPLQPLDVRLPIIEALELLQAALDEKQVTVISTIGDMPCYVLGNQAELEQLFLNLLMNAHEAMPSGGRLSVALATTGDSATASIADSGPGIPPDLLERVFDPFFTTKQRGSGLGLAVCAGIAQAHQAKLRAANRSEGGALFTVEFPLVAAAPARAPA